MVKRFVLNRLDDETPWHRAATGVSGPEPPFIAISARIHIARSLQSRLNADFVLPPIGDSFHPVRALELELAYDFHRRLHILYRCLRQDAVAQIEDVPWP